MGHKPLQTQRAEDLNHSVTVAMCMDAENMLHARTAVLTDVGTTDFVSLLTAVRRIYDHFICACSVGCVVPFAVCLLATWVVHDFYKPFVCCVHMWLDG